MSQAEPTTSQASVPPGYNGPVFPEWWDGLLWHRVLRSPVLGLRPGRLGLAFFFTVSLLLLLSIGGMIDARLVTTRPPLPWPDLSRESTAPLAIWNLFVLLPVTLARSWPVTVLIMGPALIVLGGVLMGAVSRITAEEFSKGRQISWQQGLSFAARMWQSIVTAYLGPIVLIWLIALIFAAAGWVLMNWPVLNIIGGLLYGLFLLGALLAVVLGVVYLLGKSLLIPAVVCEGADAIDAFQRAYAYVLARPLRLIIYLVMALAAVAVVALILAALAWWTIGFAALGTGAWARPRGWGMLWWGSFAAAPPAETVSAPGALEQPGGTYAVGAAFIRLWVLVPILLVLASLLSMWTATTTVIYLAMRRICDGQDIAELWMPGAVEASMAEVMAARQQAAAQYRTTEHTAARDLEQPDYQ
jgi:hypothetical protein